MHCQTMRLLRLPDSQHDWVLYALNCAKFFASPSKTVSRSVHIENYYSLLQESPKLWIRIEVRSSERIGKEQELIFGELRHWLDKNYSNI